MQLTVLAGGVFCAVASAAITVAYVSGGDPFDPCRADHGINTAQIGSGFELTSETGVALRDTDIVTGPTLVYFGYTFCPDVCPMDNARNAEAAYLLEDAGAEHRLQTVFISIDPGRDTPEVLAEFTDYFHPDMIGLTGTPEVLAELAQSYRTYYQAQEAADDGYYLVDHSTYSYLLMPDYGVVDIVMRDTPAEEVAEQASCMAQAVTL